MPSNLNIDPYDTSAHILRDHFGIDNVFGAWRQVDYGNGPSWEPDYEAWIDGRGWTDWGIWSVYGYRSPGLEHEGYPPNYQYTSYLAFRAKGFYTWRHHPRFVEVRAKAIDPGFWARIYRWSDPQFYRYGVVEDWRLARLPTQFYLRPDLGPSSLTAAGGEPNNNGQQFDITTTTYQDSGIPFWDGVERESHDANGRIIYDDGGYPHPPERKEPLFTAGLGRVGDWVQPRTYYSPPVPPPEPAKFDVLRYSRYKSEGRNVNTRNRGATTTPAEPPPPPPPPPPTEPTEPTQPTWPGAPTPVSYPLQPIASGAMNDDFARAYQLDADYRFPHSGAAGSTQVLNAVGTGWPLTYRNTYALWWYFDLPPDTSLAITADNVGTEGDSHIGLYQLLDDGSLSLVASADDNAGDGDGRISNFTLAMRSQETRYFVVCGMYSSGAVTRVGRINYNFAVPAEAPPPPPPSNDNPNNDPVIVG